jgi:hypothetical protein
MEERTLYRADAVFELTLGTVLIAGVVTGRLGATDFPVPAAHPVLLALGGLLIAVAGYLWFGARGMLLPLALANDLTGLIAVGWLIVATGFSATGVALLLATIVGLFCLSSAQFWTARLR